MKKLLLLFTAAILSAQGHSATLTWTDAINPAGTTWNVYRAPTACTASPVFVKLTATALTVKTYVDSTVVAGSFCYQITAVFGGIESAPSNSAGATFPAPPVLLPLTIQ
jgi:hypothetical protein